MGRYWKAIFGQVRALQRRFIRDRMSLFFTFLFPVLFLLIFGSIFNNQDVSLKVAVINHSSSQFAEEFVQRAANAQDSPLEVKAEIDSLEMARQKLKHSEISAIIELPKDFGVVTGGPDQPRPSGTLTVLYAKGSEQAGQTVSAILTQIIDGINTGMGHPAPPLKVTSYPVGDEALKQFDYTFTGLLAFSLMSMGIFGLANAMPAEKKRGSYRRLRAAPFSSGQLIIANSIHYTIIALVSLAVMMVVGLLVFQFNMRGDWVVFWLFALLAALLMVGFGLLIGGWCRNENQSAVLSNIIAFPMMFLSGAFFPVFLFPGWLQVVSQFIPIAPIVEGFRMIVTEHASLIDLGPQLLAMGAWMAVVYSLAIYLFRWE